MPFSAVSEIVRRHSADRTRGRARPPGGAGAGGGGVLLSGTWEQKVMPARRHR